MRRHVLGFVAGLIVACADTGRSVAPPDGADDRSADFLGDPSAVATPVAVPLLAVGTDGSGPTVWYPDEDGDGHGVPLFSVTAEEAPAGYAATADDCRDLEPRAHPGATEVCDGIDNDCDYLSDAEDPDLGGLACFFPDLDGDGYGDSAAGVAAAEAPSGAIARAGDCDDAAPDVNPSAADVCRDGLDTNCDGSDCGDPLEAPWGAITTVTGDVGFGDSVTALGDVDSDGVTDVWVGHRGRGDAPYGGYLVSGALVGEHTVEAALAGFESDTFLTVLPAGDADADGRADVWTRDHHERVISRVSGVTLLAGSLDGEATYDFSTGRYVYLSSLGDLQADGVDDVAVVAPDGVYLLDGALNGRLSPADARTRILWPAAYAQRQAHTGRVGDLDGDGLDDLLFGDLEHMAGGLIFHAEELPPGIVAKSDLDLVLTGPHPVGGRIGFEIASAGDLDGDGLPDTIVSGLVYLGPPERWDAPVAWSRDTLTAAGDVDGDGQADLLVHMDPPGVYFGPITGRSLGGELAELSDQRRPYLDWEVSGTPRLDAAGDLDGDGLDDVFASIPALEGYAYGYVTEGPGTLWILPGSAIR